jgi:L-amino acid N-acyltransferase YncA
VRSRLKGHGLGWLLMQCAIDYAKEKGLRRVYGDVLAENTMMLQMCAELGFHTEDLGSSMRRECNCNAAGRRTAKVAGTFGRSAVF